MFIPLFSRRRSPQLRGKFGRRKGGGGGRGGSRGGGGLKGPSEGGGGVSSGSPPTPKLGEPSFSSVSHSPMPISYFGTSGNSIPFGSGGGPTTKVSRNMPFAGREVGGATRNQVYGTSAYGSGYPGQAGRGVAGRGFPFYYWPVVFLAPAALIGAGITAEALDDLPYAYLYRTTEYGAPDNTTRPGGPLHQTSFESGSTTLHIISDDSTTEFLYTTIQSSCRTSTSNTVTFSPPSPYSQSNPPIPRPEQAIQYYRASSVVLTLDGYNNTAVFSPSDDTPPVPLPSNLDTNFLNCVNLTIGQAVPLIGRGSHIFVSTNLLVGFWVLGLLSFYV